MSAKTNDAIDLGPTKKVSKKRLTVSLKHQLSTFLLRSPYIRSKFKICPSLCIYFRYTRMFIYIGGSCSESTTMQASETI
jgi:hypothetical protein